MAKKSLMQLLINAADMGIGFSEDADEIENDLPMDWRERVCAAAGVEDVDVPFVFFQDGRIEAQFGMPFAAAPQTADAADGDESGGGDGNGTGNGTGGG